MLKICSPLCLANSSRWRTCSPASLRASRILDFPLPVFPLRSINLKASIWELCSLWTASLTSALYSLYPPWQWITLLNSDVSQVVSPSGHELHIQSVWVWLPGTWTSDPPASSRWEVSSCPVCLPGRSGCVGWCFYWSERLRASCQPFCPFHQGMRVYPPRCHLSLLGIQSPNLHPLLVRQDWPVDGARHAVLLELQRCPHV